MGRLSFTDASDPRYALAFINSGDLVSSVTIGGSLRSTDFGPGDSFVIGCSFHDTRGTALGVFGSNKLYADSNVFYSVLDQGIRIEGSGHNLRKNLLVYQSGISGTSLDDNRGFLDISGCSDSPLMVSNVVAGASTFSMSSMSLTCADNGITWTDNVLHSSQIGYFQLGSSPTATSCVVVSGIRIYSMNTFSIYTNSEISMEIKDVMLFDNPGGIYTYVSGPNGRTHERSYKYVKISNSLIVGNTGMQLCGQTANPATRRQNMPISRSPLGGNLGILLPNFMSGQNMPDMALTGWSSENALDGQTIIQARFFNFTHIVSKLIMIRSMISVISYEVQIGHFLK
ncbi:Fibrocystin-L [Cichlidogyrus casuarinus]|uniref:Fibrocystin-L n=1 Tax=Cichlidogyrus casuarinus TaxID=1844966 RepID=A0ABD2QCS2_9PLAT